MGKLGFWVLGLGFRVLSFGLRVSGLGFREKLRLVSLISLQ